MLLCGQPEAQGILRQAYLSNHPRGLANGEGPLEFRERLPVLQAPPQLAAPLDSRFVVISARRPGHNHPAREPTPDAVAQPASSGGGERFSHARLRDTITAPKIQSNTHAAK